MCCRPTCRQNLQKCAPRWLNCSRLAEYPALGHAPNPTVLKSGEQNHDGFPRQSVIHHGMQHQVTILTSTEITGLGNGTSGARTQIIAFTLKSPCQRINRVNSQAVSRTLTARHIGHSTRTCTGIFSVHLSRTIFPGSF